MMCRPSAQPITAMLLTFAGSSGSRPSAFFSSTVEFSLSATMLLAL